MKNTWKVFAACFAMVSFIACDNSETAETTTDSMNVESTTDASTSMTTSGSTVTPGKYIDLSSGKEVQIDRDASTGRWVDVTTRTPVEYYISIDTRDTFDAQGRNVSNALDRSSDGKFMVNEERLRVKMDDDGDMKIKDGDETKMKYDKSSDELKYKDDTSKQKSSGGQ